jgi:hypothetical protein
VLEAVEEALLQVHGMASNTKQQGIFCIMGKNCNGFNNQIGGNKKIKQALDIKEGFDINYLMYYKHRINFRHKDNKNDLKQSSSANWHARRSRPTAFNRHHLFWRFGWIHQEYRERQQRPEQVVMGPPWRHQWA